MVGFVAGAFASPGAMRALWRGDRRGFLHELVLILLGLGFVVAPEPVWADLIYALLLPVALYHAWESRREFRWRVLPLPLLSAGILILWFLATLFWSGPVQVEHGSPAFWLRNALCTVVFVFVLADALRFRPGFRERLMRGFVLLGMLNAVIAFIRLPFIVYKSWAFGDLRMSGWAETRHPILGAVIMGAVVLMAIDSAIRTKDRRYWAAAVVGVIFIALTGSRGPETAAATAIAVLLGWRRPRLLLVLTILLLAAIGLLALLDSALLHKVLEAQLARGNSDRFAIWRAAWPQIWLHPWLGQGLNTRIVCPAGDCLAVPFYTFPHNLFLSTWLYSGIIGLVLLGCYLLVTLLHALQPADTTMRPFNVALLVLLLISALTDLSQVVKGPGPMWYIFWLTTLLASIPGVGQKRLQA